MIAKVAGTLLLAALTLPAYAAEDIYRWIDETGRVNYGNVVPDRFKRIATKIDTSGSRVAVTNGRQNEPSASTGSSAPSGASAGAGQPPVTGPHGVGY